MVKTLIATLAFAVTASVMAPVAAQADYYGYDRHAHWRHAHYEHMRWRHEHYRHMHYGY